MSFHKIVLVGLVLSDASVDDDLLASFDRKNDIYCKVWCLEAQHLMKSYCDLECFRQVTHLFFWESCLASGNECTCTSDFSVIM